MAKAKSSAPVGAFIRKPKKRGKASKKQTSNKRSKNYKKPYRGQGR